MSLLINSARERAERRRLRPPVQRATLCRRELVLRSLQVARAGKLTILVGPAGYGKTTVLAQWWELLKSEGTTVAWYTASSLDREPFLFLAMLAKAFGSAGVEMEGALSRKTGDGAPAGLLDAILLQLDRLEEPAVIIIDDFDRVEHPAIAQLVQEMIQVFPDHVNIVIATRKKPYLFTSVMREQGAVRIIDPSELRLSDTEVSEVLGLAPHCTELPGIADQTEGWPVAVQLYRLWRERRGANPQLPRFGGQLDEVADYLAEQIVSTLSQEQQALLTDLSLFDYIEPGFADHVRGRSDSVLLLEELEATLPSLVHKAQSAAEEAAYRLHPLIADYARARLHRSPGVAAQFHARAADWLWMHERYADAVRHRVAASDRPALLTMLGSVPFIPIFLAHGSVELRSILRETPADLVDSLPRLQLMAALAHFKLGYFGEALAWLERIEQQTQGFSHDPTGRGKQLQIEGAALQLFFHAYVEGPTATCDTLVHQLQRVAPDVPLMWAWSENTMIVVHQQRGDLSASRNAIIRTAQSYQSSNKLTFAEEQLRYHDILAALAHGSLHAAARLARATLKLDPPQVVKSGVFGMARMGIAAIEYVRHYREQAADTIRLAFEQFGEADAWFDQYAIVWQVIIDVAWRRHGRGAALQGIAQLRARLKSRGVNSVNVLLDALEAIYCLRGGETAAAVSLVAALPALEKTVPWRARDLILQARILLELARGNPAAALEHANALVTEGQTGERLGTIVKGFVLLACAHEASGDPAAANEAILSALGYGFPEEMVAPFAEESQVVAGLIRRVLGECRLELDRSYAEAILAAFALPPARRTAHALSDREAEILAHLTDGASNKLIARRLGLTENTIKFHLKKIFAKLGVTSRKAAVARMSAQPNA